MALHSENLFLKSLLEEIRICNYILELTERYKSHESILIKNVRIVDLEQNSLTESKDVLISKGVITKIADNITDPDSMKINAKGKFLLPGLIDMHVHHELSNAQHLLHITNGILTVREMCGYPGFLNVRDKINAQELFAPTIKVASNMLNEFQFNRFTTKVETVEEVRRAVNSIKEQGYDYIKIWNKFSLENFNAALEESKKLGIPTVAHIPVGIDVKQAIDSGLLTFEHFKGYLDDSTMKIPDQDYITPTPKTGQWNCPTFKVFENESLIGNEADRYFETMKEIKYISPYQLYKWKIDVKERTKEVMERGFNIPNMHLNHQKTIFSNLMEKGVEFLAGTDFGGGYPFCIPGFGLFDEVEFMHNIGLSLLETIRSTTLYAGKALGIPIGEIRENAIGNVILLKTNPLDDLKALRSEKDVIFQGRYLQNEDLEEILKFVYNVYSEDLDINHSNIDHLEIIDFFEKNPIFIRAEILTEYCEYLTNLGYIDDAIRIYELVVNYTRNAFNYEYLENLKDKKNYPENGGLSIKN